MVRTAFSVLVLLLFAVEVQSRFVPKNSTDLVSDGILHGQQTSVLLLEHSASSSSSETCEMTYGFLPCTTTIFGNLFLVVVYGYLMFLGATCLSNGCELLLEILGPGIIGGLFLPILGALPDALLILVSGLSGSKETAQQQVLIGMGLLAGSTVMLLTLLWGSCVIVGKCDLSEGSTAVDLQDTKGFSLTGSGITTDKLTSYAARIMVISIAPFIIVQIPQVFHLSSGRRISVLVALIVSILCLLSYCLFQVFQPWVQKRKIEYAKLRHVMSSVLNNAQKRALGKLYTEDGKPNEDIIRKLFHAIDLNSDAKVSSSEFRALLVGINFTDLGLNEQDALQKVMADFDSSSDSYIDENEFVNGLSRWLHDADRTVTEPTHHSKKLHHYHLRTWEEHNMLLDKSEEDGDAIGSPSWIFFKAVMLLLLGTAIAAIFADPLVDAVDNFSSATSIPSFFISFIAMPLATNSSEAVAAIIFSSRKKQRTASLTFSEIYGAVTMNNVLCLAVFLAIVYIRQLTWDFSAEVLVILIVVVIMGLFTSFRTTFQLWTCIVAILLYPLSLVLVYVLDYILGWS